MSGFDDFRGRIAERQPYRFTNDDVDAMQKLGVIGMGWELLDGIHLMRKSDVPVRLHPVDLPALYEAGIIPASCKTEMIGGVVYAM